MMNAVSLKPIRRLYVIYATLHPNNTCCRNENRETKISRILSVIARFVGVLISCYLLDTSTGVTVALISTQILTMDLATIIIKEK